MYIQNYSLFTVFKALVNKEWLKNIQTSMKDTIQYIGK